jgi:hypothetical protein
VFLVVTGTTDWRLGLAAGLVAQIIAIVATRPRRVGLLNAGMLVFFAGFGVFSLLRPDSGLAAQLTNISVAWLTVLAAGSIVVGRPFTLQYSQDDVSPEIAASVLFMSINRTIAWAWTAAFAVMAVAGFVAGAAGGRGWGAAVSVVVIVAAVRFTKRYPDRAVAAARVDRPAPVPIG